MISPVKILFPVQTRVACWPTRTESDDGDTDIEGVIAQMNPLYKLI
jgi:hypothetical protein